MRIQNLNLEWAMDTLDMLRRSFEAATEDHDKGCVDCPPIKGELQLRQSIRASLKSVQSDLANAVVSLRGILRDTEQINALHRKRREDKPPAEDDLPF